VGEVVVDASALLALLHDEPGGDAVSEALPGAAVSTVNLSEVVAKLSASGLPAGEIRTALAGLGLEIHPFTEDQALTAGLLRGATRAAGLGLGDRACLALGAALARPVLTSDRAWKGLRVGVDIQVLR
jgi:PIN domain nuclease of toxin-antitoxin system